MGRGSSKKGKSQEKRALRKHKKKKRTRHAQHITKKDYNSPEYFAKHFRSFLKQEPPYQKRFGATFKAERQNNQVYFSIHNTDYCITFDRDKSKIVASLDEKVDRNYTNNKNLTLNPLRSKEGKLSSKYIPELFKELFSSENSNKQ